MKSIDLLQWAFLACIAAGCFLISLEAGLIVTGILGILGTTIGELSAAIDARRRHAEELRRRG